jgi:hypothetical protein
VPPARRQPAHLGDGQQPGRRAVQLRPGVRGADRDGPAGDGETIAAQFLAWLAETGRLWLVVLDDVSDPADLDGLWPAGPAGQVLATTAAEGTVPAARQPALFPMGAFRQWGLPSILIISG